MWTVERFEKLIKQNVIDDEDYLKRLLDKYWYLKKDIQLETALMEDNLGEDLYNDEDI